MMYKVYAENTVDAARGIKNRRFIANCEGTNTGSGIFELYADECDDEEEIVIVPVYTDREGKEK